MTVGIVGLGLIGGSLARAYKESGEATVYGLDRNESVQEFAIMAGAIDGALNDETLPLCDLVLLAVYPGACIDYFRDNAEKFSKNTLIMDCGGTKTVVCQAIFPIAKEHGLTFVGGHPMAGSHNSGFKYSRGNLFRGAPMVIVPPAYDDILLLDRVKKLLAPVGFGRFSVTTAEKHDEMIAFTSQLAHVVSNAYIKSPTASSHKGFSAGSYKDLTRVAWLDPNMWSELFLENKEHLLFELDTIIASLSEYRKAIAEDDHPRLISLLDDGRKRKEEVDGR